MRFRGMQESEANSAKIYSTRSSDGRPGMESEGRRDRDRKTVAAQRRAATVCKRCPQTTKRSVSRRTGLRPRLPPLQSSESDQPPTDQRQTDRLGRTNVAIKRVGGEERATVCEYGLLNGKGSGI